jgi:cell fate regulator YaaT (PSP1 superfamily)
MYITKVRLRKPTRVFTFSCEERDVDLRRGENCIVKSDRGTEYGTVVVPPEPCPDGMSDRYNMNVLRKASIADDTTYSHILAEEQKAKEVCQRRIAERGMAMKLVDVEYTFDRHKVIFYFTAAERVDFRELVRDLAQELKARIELRHIQVRDEAKIVGGLGVCGRELCCSTFLTEFKPISMRMAKQQNLSLNPTKISGQCGRLLCCLAYENDLYKGKKAELGLNKPIPKPAGEDDAADNFDWDVPVPPGVSVTTDGEPVKVEDDVALQPSAVVELVEGSAVEAGVESDFDADANDGEEDDIAGAATPETPTDASAPAPAPQPGSNANRDRRGRRGGRRRNRHRRGGGGGGQGQGPQVPRQ